MSLQRGLKEYEFGMKSVIILAIYSWYFLSQYYVMTCKMISMKPTLYNHLVILIYYQNMFKIPHALKPITLFTSHFVLNNLVI